MIRPGADDGLRLWFDGLGFHWLSALLHSDEQEEARLGRCDTLVSTRWDPAGQGVPPHKDLV